jgi:hypothetical protein
MCALIMACLMLAGEVICRFSDRRATEWVAHVYWDGSYYRHAARSEADALDWLCQYPRHSTGLVERLYRGAFTITTKRVTA